MADLEPVDSGADDHLSAQSSAAALQAILIGEHSFEGLLGLVAEMSHHLVEGAIATSVTVRSEGKPFTSNYSKELALDLDNFQYSEGHGPCVESLEKGIQVHELVDEHSEWGEFRIAALKAGVSVVLATPLRVRDDSFGALNIYGDRLDVFSDLELSKVRVFAEQAGIVLTNALAFAGAESLNAQLREALDSRDVIGQAKGILMERQSLTATQAFELLRKTSQRSNRKLFEVAMELVERVEKRSIKDNR